MCSDGAFEAKKNVRQLLDLVEQGQAFTITGRGEEATRAAVRRIRERAEQLKFGRFDWSEWKSFRDEGRL
jgi:antitoxin (DNA-binding transcriptional repressor) of toxin-antitoxin stability system